MSILKQIAGSTQKKTPLPEGSGIFVVDAVGENRLPAAATAAAPRTIVSFVHAERTAAHLVAVESLDGRLSSVIVHLHETKAAGAAGFTIVDQSD